LLSLQCDKRWSHRNSECSWSLVACQIRAEWGSPWWYFVLLTFANTYKWGSYFQRYWWLYQRQLLGLGSMCSDEQKWRQSHARCK
jgi:hypothetical protein